MADDKNKPSGPPRPNGETNSFMGEVVVELGDSRNRSFMWAPTQEELRGRWAKGNLKPDEMVDPLLSMPDIPGIYLQVDGPRRNLRIIDPLSFGENRALLADVHEIVKNWQRTEIAPCENKEIKDANETDIKTWLYWMRRLVDGGPVDRLKKQHWLGGPQARVVSGHLPNLADIAKLPGKTLINQFDPSHKRCRFLEDAVAELANP